LNETTDKNNPSFRQTDEVEQTVHHFSTRDNSHSSLRRDDNDQLNMLREEIESYIQDKLNKLEDSLLTRIETTGGIGEKGEKGEKGDTGLTGARGADGTDFNISDYFDICE